MIYEWKPKFPNEKVEAQVVGELVERLRVENAGCLTPEMVVEAARPKESPLHSLFVWDDTLAATLWREEQAQGIIRALVVRVESRPDLPVRAFVSVVSEDDERSYTSVTVAMQTPRLRQQVIMAAHAEIVSWRKRYQDLREFSKLFEEIDQLEL